MEPSRRSAQRRVVPSRGRVSLLWGPPAAAAIVLTGLYLAAGRDPGGTEPDPVEWDEIDVPPVETDDTVETADVVVETNLVGVGGAAGGRYSHRRGGCRVLVMGCGGSRRSEAAPSPGAALPAFSTEEYDPSVENPFLSALQNPLSTFSVDVDTASYANIRRTLVAGTLPPKGAVRIEEMLNSFRYGDAPPEDGSPFAVHTEAAGCPWSPGHRLLRIALRGRDVPQGERPPCNLVFLVDVSGSMQPQNKLPLVQRSLRMLAESLRADDRVALVVYAGAAGLVLPSTPCADRARILDAIDRLSAGGSTDGGSGIRLAYETAAANRIEGGINRVILATDGDFNVGVTSRDELVSLVEERARGGVFLTVLGYGMGNLKDATLEQLADRGNGHYAYIDTIHEARRVLVTEAGGILQTIAKDVKIQVEFNPARVAAYRLIGYENRMLRSEDFNDDAKDAGEIGAGHCVTALYEIAPAADGGERLAASLAALTGSVDPLLYQSPPRLTDAARASGDLLTLRLRHKAPDGEESLLRSFPVRDEGGEFACAGEDLRFSAAVAAFGMVLRESALAGDLAGAPADPGVLSAHAADLGADSFEVREEASRALAQAGPAARPVLEEALRSDDPEIRERAGRILADLGRSFRARQCGAIAALADAARGADPGGARAEFVDLVRRAGVLLDARPAPAIGAASGG